MQQIIRDGRGDYLDDATYELGRTFVAQERYREGAAVLEPFVETYVYSPYRSAALSELGLAYLNRYVKALAVSYDGGRHYVHPSVKSAMRKEYPIVRPLYYDKKNETAVKPFLQFTASPESRKKTLELGFIPR